MESPDPSKSSPRADGPKPDATGSPTGPADPDPASEARTIDHVREMSPAADPCATASFRPSGSATDPGRDLAGAATGAVGLNLDDCARDLAESGLMDAAEVASFRERIAAREGLRDAEALARELVRAGRLTRYQAGAVLKGKTKGLMIGNYVVLDKLGAGGMGLVYRARHRRLKRDVALKLLPPSSARDPSAVLRFQREAKAAAKLNHPNVVAVLDADEDRGLHFLVMEYAEGRDLSRFVREQGTLPVLQAIDCIVQAARGLKAAFDASVVHRDIKPSNLLLDPGGTVKILDLGLARLDDTAGVLGAIEPDAGLTQSNVLMGTVDYMSPEQAFNPRLADHRSDIYSLGCTLYFLLTGRPPYTAETLVGRLIAHREHPIPSLRAARADVPEILDVLLSRMLAKSPEARVSSLDELIASLNACRSDAGGPPGSGPSPVLAGVPPATGPDSGLILDAGVEPIAGYKLVRLLGRGGFGEVWEASAPGGVHVALKFIRLDSHAAGVEQRALEIICNIRHPHLLDVQFATRVADCLVLAMPLCDESLMDRLRACPAGLPRNELLGYIVDLAHAVDYLNEPHHRVGNEGLVGVQHRDIKPHNIFLVGGSVRLADFGLAKILASSSGSHTGSRSPNYAAPEMSEGRVSQGSDQYSLAVTYFQLRTGRLPFEGDSPSQIVYAHIHNPPDLSGLPEQERPVLAQALAKRPEQRGPSCRAFVLGLAAAARTGNEQIAPRPRRRRLWRVVLAGLAAGLAVLVALVFITREGPTRKSVSGVTVSPGVEVKSPQPPAQTAPPDRLEIVEKPDAPLSRPSPPDLTKASPAPRAPDPVVPRLTLPVEPPKLITNTIGMKLVLIPAGEFLMGSPDSVKDAFDDEKPQHRVRITRPFYLRSTEVTQEQYRAVTGEDPSHFKGSDDLPVEQVTWNDAISFCNKLSEKEGLKPFYASDAGAPTGGDGYGLPTEAEWEYACRAGSTTKFSFGDDAASLGEYARFDGNSGDKTHPVGQKRPNAFGLYDMHGNVFEWCWDWYDGRYYSQPPGADPLGPTHASNRVIRGGGWGSSPRHVRSAYRNRLTPGFRGNGLGFRLARVHSVR